MSSKPKKDKKDKKTKKQKPSCLECGICCCPLNSQEFYCDLGEKDIERLPEKYRKHIVFERPQSSWYFHPMMAKYGAIPVLKTKHLDVRNGPLRGLNVTRCILLKGDPYHKVSCLAYEDRPESCRKTMTPGDKHCLGLRKLIREFIKENPPEKKGNRGIRT